MVLWRWYIFLGGWFCESSSWFYVVLGWLCGVKEVICGSVMVEGGGSRQDTKTTKLHSSAAASPTAPPLARYQTRCGPLGRWR